MSLTAEEHEAHLGDEEHQQRPQIDFQQIDNPLSHTPEPLNFLHLVQLLVVAVHGEQLFVSATLYDTSFM